MGTASPSLQLLCATLYKNVRSPGAAIARSRALLCAAPGSTHMPVGAALFPEAFTVAVNVSACPTNDGLSDEASVVDVNAGLVPE
jgi:hypothetical protein